MRLRACVGVTCFNITKSELWPLNIYALEMSLKDAGVYLTKRHKLFDLCNENTLFIPRSNN
jgi:hypothetical protein